MSKSSASVSQRITKGGTMRTLEIDLEEAARRPLTPSEIAQLEAAEAREPDTDDIPELPPEAWAAAVRGKIYKARKESISLRIDMDVLAWLRRFGPGYQTKINAILREKMLSEIEPLA
jgi:uncharacterized protein (DUF4415 family)